ncbi:MAG: hypothetical protein IPH42_20595 [Bacteroidetes bacterium]|nr:hypothetical protein [Bacteroidota bacterium]
MPLKRDSKVRNNADGSISKVYCSYCYEKVNYL